MAIRNIVKEGDDILNKKCRPVEKFDQKLHTLLNDMAETMYNAEGVGLAAPQVGILRRVAVIDVSENRNELIKFINPQIIAFSGEQTGNEGCLSFPGQYGIVTRPDYVKVKALNRFGEEFVTEGRGLLARAICHETDHLNGMVFKKLAQKMLSKREIEEMTKKRR